MTDEDYMKRMATLDFFKFKQMIYSSFHLTEENMEFYVESLNKFRSKA